MKEIRIGRIPLGFPSVNVVHQGFHGFACTQIDMFPYGEHYEAMPAFDTFAPSCIGPDEAMPAFDTFAPSCIGSDEAGQSPSTSDMRPNDLEYAREVGTVQASNGIGTGMAPHPEG